MEGKKILIVEDDEFLQGIASTKLQKEGFTVVAAANGDDAKTQINEDGIDLLLLDLVLPGNDGFDVLETVRNDAAHKDLPIIVFSNLAEDKDISRAQELGATEFMIKSNFTLDELVEKIKSVLNA